MNEHELQQLGHEIMASEGWAPDQEPQLQTWLLYLNQHRPTPPWRPEWNEQNRAALLRHIALQPSTPRRGRNWWLWLTPVTVLLLVVAIYRYEINPPSAPLPTSSPLTTTPDFTTKEADSSPVPADRMPPRLAKMPTRALAEGSVSNLAPFGLSTADSLATGGEFQAKIAERERTAALFGWWKTFATRLHTWWQRLTSVPAPQSTTTPTPTE